MTHYEALKIQQTATADEIKAAFRAEAIKTHPDHNPGDAEAAKRFLRVREAYEVLSDPGRRADYDGLDLDLLTILSEVFQKR